MFIWGCKLEPQVLEFKSGGLWGAGGFLEGTSCEHIISSSWLWYKGAPAWAHLTCFVHTVGFDLVRFGEIL